jgi:hypothetical protein
MIGDEHPCLTGRFPLGQKFGKVREEIVPVPVVQEFLLGLDLSDHDVVQNSGQGQAGLSQRGGILLQPHIPGQITFLPASPLRSYQRPHSAPTTRI